MGSSSVYKCQACEHRFIGIGGSNIVVSGCTETHRCLQCNAVFERLIKTGAYDYQDGNPKENPRCPECESLKIVGWKQSDGCPRCEGTLSATPTCCETL